MSTSNEVEALENYIMPIAGEMIGCGTYSGGSGNMVDRRFRQLFGCGLSVVISVWNLLLENDTIEGATVHHLLWALLFLEVYSDEAT
jgi:hypothetical protein